MKGRVEALARTLDTVSTKL